MDSILSCGLLTGLNYIQYLVLCIRIEIFISSLLRIGVDINDSDLDSSSDEEEATPPKKLKAVKA